MQGHEKGDTLLAAKSNILSKFMQSRKLFKQEILFLGAQCRPWEWRQLCLKDNVSTGNGREDTNPEKNS